MPQDNNPETLAGALVQRHFGVTGPHLTIGGLRAADLAERFGTPLFVYDAGTIRASHADLASTLVGFAEIHYSIKANPNPEVARLLVDAGAGLEVASGAEYLRGRASGCAPERILFAGPGKKPAEIALVVEGGIGEIHLESYEEMAEVNRAGVRAGCVVPVALRINPQAVARGGAMRMGGAPSPFGFDEEELEAAVDAVGTKPNLALQGVHLFSGTQILEADLLLAQWAHGLAVAARVAARLGRPLATVDLGGGLGIPYFSGDAFLDLSRVQEGMPALLQALRSHPLLAQARVVVEPGRYLVGSSGVYLARVLAVKVSRGRRFVITDGGMHHHLAASGNLGQVVKRDYPLLAANRMDRQDRTPCVIAGPLCTPLDVLGRQVDLPLVVPGDLVAVLQSGAYGLTASPAGFLSHPMPAEVLVEGGAAREIRARGSFAAPLTALP